MHKLLAIAAGALLVASAAFAEDHHHGGGGGSHGGPPSHGGGPSGFHGPGFHGADPFRGHSNAGAFHARSGGMPSRNFRGVPPGFHGSLPHGSASPSRAGVGHGFGGPGHDMGRFHGHDFAHFSADERAAWQHGGWRHAWHNGHYGWWWFAGGDWFFYPAPIYPYPEYVGSADYYDYYDENGAQPYYWYYCENPPGYFPYVQQCYGPWEPVPPQAANGD
jgi:hypothetical protein